LTAGARLTDLYTANLRGRNGIGLSDGTTDQALAASGSSN
jgi:hypothetical protein